MIKRVVVGLLLLALGVAARAEERCASPPSAARYSGPLTDAMAQI